MWRGIYSFGAKTYFLKPKERVCKRDRFRSQTSVGVFCGVDRLSREALVLDPKNHQKHFKLNCLGVFLGTPWEHL